MGISNYTELTDAISNWLNHEDPATKDRIPTFLALAEIRAGRGIHTLRMQVHEQHTVTAEEATNQAINLPADYNGMVALYISGCPMTQLSASQWLEAGGAANRGGSQYAYAIIGDTVNIVAAVGEDAVIDWIYYAQPVPLSPVNQANTLSNYYADVLLYGALGEAMPYLKDEKRLPNFAQLYDAGLKAIELDDENQRFADGGPQPVLSRYTADANNYRSTY